MIQFLTKKFFFKYFLKKYFRKELFNRHKTVFKHCFNNQSYYINEIF